METAANYTSAGRTYKICFKYVTEDVVLHSDKSARRYSKARGAKSAWRPCKWNEGSNTVGYSREYTRVYNNS
jgi:hypothetical protein